MYAKRLTVKNFRNYQEETFHFAKETNILYGDNAQGKTNALEALYLFSIGRSFRTKQDRDMIRFGEESTKLELIFCDAHREHTIEIIIRRDHKKQIKVNGVVISRLSELVGRLSVVLFSPAELSLVKDGPHVRRRFLDIALSQMRPRYYYLLGRYNKVLEQRNNLIKKLRGTKRPALEATVTVWNEKLADYGMELVRYRRDFVARLGEFAARIHQEIAGETLGLSYRTRFENRDDFLEKLSRNFSKELEQGCTLYGPHRDDLLIEINGCDAKGFASQGQQRSAVLSFKLAQADLLYDETGENPILLLDDIMSELDLGRRTYLARKIHNKQTVITCTDVDGQLLSEKSKNMQIKAGSVIE